MLVGVTGKAGAGKDTFAKFFTDRGYARHSFADPIKRMIELAFDLDPSVWDDREAKEAPIPWLGKSPRYLAQTLGTEWGREKVHPDLWLLLAEQAVLKHANLIIPDARFDNEARWIREHGGVIVRVERPDPQAMDNAGHASEAGVDPGYCDYIVQNRGTIEDLTESAANLYNLWP